MDYVAIVVNVRTTDKQRCRFSVMRLKELLLQQIFFQEFVFNKLSNIINFIKKYILQRCKTLEKIAMAKVLYKVSSVF